MGRRSRKRAGGASASEPDGGGASDTGRDASSRGAPRDPRQQSAAGKTRVERFIERADHRPKAPWHPFPLVELCVLAGIVLIVFGITRSDTDSGKLMLLFGLVLASLAGFDTAVRDHFAGFRSHSTLLSGLPAVLVAGVLFFVRAPWALVLVAAFGVFMAAFTYFRATFRRRSGGLSFRV